MVTRGVKLAFLLQGKPIGPRFEREAILDEKARMEMSRWMRLLAEIYESGALPAALVYVDEAKGTAGVYTCNCAQADDAPDFLRSVADAIEGGVVEDVDADVQ